MECYHRHLYEPAGTHLLPSVFQQKCAYEKVLMYSHQTEHPPDNREDR